MASKPSGVSRRIAGRPDWDDPDGVKVYTISATGREVDQAVYAHQLTAMKKQQTVDWPLTPAFAIFHDGASSQYLTLCWWGNDNELFTRVAVREPRNWVENAARYSFCLWDLEVMWRERQHFIETVYCAQPDLAAYRRRR